MNVALKAEERRTTADTAAISLLPTHPGSWVEFPFEKLMQLPRKEREALQLAAMQHRFKQMKDTVASLERLVERQGVQEINSIADALPLFFDHRVYKSYPISLIENRDFAKLTAWMNRLTMHDLLKVDLSGLKTLDEWLTRLESYGMMIGHSTGTTGKLSFIPRSRVEWPAWQEAYNSSSLATTGVDSTKEFIPTFFPGYRGGHHMMLKMLNLFSVPAAGGPEHWHTLYPTDVSSDLMSLAGRMQAAEDKGELAKLGLDPALLQKRDEMIAQGRRRTQDMEAWFFKLIEEFRGKRVKINGTFSDLTRIAVSGKAKGLKCSFAPGSFILSGGGMKGYKEAPPDWEDQIKQFFGIDKMYSNYGMSECMGLATMCSCGFFHFAPYTIPIVLDKDAKELPREGVQTGRLALFDLLAETYWGGFISGDQVIMHWDDNCDCGWKGPRVERTITRFAEMEGGDDKITCAGSAQAYNEFMDYVMQV
jgi:hypothetical protein